jgi:hypothetical protein
MDALATQGLLTHISGGSAAIFPRVRKLALLKEMPMNAELFIL